MNGLSKKNIHIQIMLIAIIGGFGFLCYLLFNFSIAKENERRIQNIRTVKFPILESISIARSKLTYTKNILANAIGLEDIDRLNEADLSMKATVKSLNKISEYNPELTNEIIIFSELLNKYYQPARKLSYQLIEDPTQLELHADTAITINTKYSILSQRLQEFREKNYNIYASDLSLANNEINNGITLGLALGLFMIIILGILAWTIANKVVRMISKSDRLKDEFLAAISHELRTPMNGINGSLELLQMSSLNKETQSYVDAAIHSSKDMMELINHVLDFSDARSGELIKHSGRFNLRLELALLSTKYQDQCKSKGVEFICDLSDIAIDDLTGDYKRMIYVLNQLLNNATKFTHNGRVILTVKQKKHPIHSNKYILQFNVSDTGIGIPSHKQGEVFEPFQQADGSFSRKHGGLGIGLSICLKLIELMEGEISFTSIKGKGSNFSLSLPFDKAPPLEHAETLPLNLNSISQATQLPKALPAVDVAIDSIPKVPTKIRVMVVEDNVVNQMVLKGILKKLGYEVITADNGEIAVNALKNEVVDVILMDCQMPIMDGFEATRSIRSSSTTNKNKPIIAITANAMTGDKERCLEAGMDDYIKKPIDKSIIQHKLEELITAGNNKQIAG